MASHGIRGFFTPSVYSGLLCPSLHSNSSSCFVFFVATQDWPIQRFFIYLSAYFCIKARRATLECSSCLSCFVLGVLIQFLLHFFPFGSLRKLQCVNFRMNGSSQFFSFFSRGHATLHLALSVRPSVRHIFEFRAFFALLLLPNHPRLDCRVSGLVSIFLRDHSQNSS